MQEVQKMATKKQFSTNPALQFISAGEEEEQLHAVPDQGGSTLTGSAPPAGYKPNPLYIEKKTKRIQLVMQPSVYQTAKAAADAAGVSFNEFVHKAIEAAIKSKEE